MYQAVMENRISQPKNPGNYSTINLTGAIGGIAGGLLLMLTGIILSAVAYFDRMSFHGLEVILLIASFIAMAIGSHYLDLMEKEKKARRIESCKKKASWRIENDAGNKNGSRIFSNKLSVRTK